MNRHLRQSVLTGEQHGVIGRGYGGERVRNSDVTNIHTHRHAANLGLVFFLEYVIIDMFLFSFFTLSNYVYISERNILDEWF